MIRCDLRLSVYTILIFSTFPVLQNRHYALSKLNENLTEEAAKSFQEAPAKERVVEISRKCTILTAVVVKIF